MLASPAGVLSPSLPASLVSVAGTVHICVDCSIHTSAIYSPHTGHCISSRITSHLDLAPLLPMPRSTASELSAASPPEPRSPSRCTEWQRCIRCTARLIYSRTHQRRPLISSPQHRSPCRALVDSAVTQLRRRKSAPPSPPSCPLITSPSTSLPTLIFPPTPPVPLHCWPPSLSPSPLLLLPCGGATCP